MLIYYTKMNTWTGEKLFLEKNLDRKEKQKQVLINKQLIKTIRSLILAASLTYFIHFYY